MLCFVWINSVLLNFLCVWIFVQPTLSPLHWLVCHLHCMVSSHRYIIRWVWNSARGPHEVAQHRWEVLHWVPAHCGLPGNEKAEELTELGAKGRQQDNSIIFQEKKTLIREALGQGIEFHFLHWWQPVVVMRLRTGHNRLNAHMFSKKKPAPSPTCNCGLEDQTAEHVLQRCPASADSKDKCVANGSPDTHQTQRQQGGIGEESHIYLADRTPSVEATERKKTLNNLRMCHTLWI